jgi:transposase
MPGPYSLDLRERVVAAVAAVAAGSSRRAVAALFKVSVSASLRRQVVTALPIRRHVRQRVGRAVDGALAGERDWLLGRLAEQPDVTLRALLAELPARGIKLLRRLALLRACCAGSPSFSVR